MSKEKTTETAGVQEAKRGRGRPKGSKNRPKVVQEAPVATDTTVQA